MSAEMTAARALALAAAMALLAPVSTVDLSAQQAGAGATAQAPPAC
jgi:hypothetical protein